MADDPKQEAEELKQALDAGTYSPTGDGPDDVAPIKEDK